MFFGIPETPSSYMATYTATTRCATPTSSRCGWFDFESSGAAEAEYDFRYLPTQGPSVHLFLANIKTSP